MSKCVFPRKSARHQFYLATIKIYQTTKLYIPGPHKQDGKEFQPANQGLSGSSICRLNLGNNTEINHCHQESNGLPEAVVSKDLPASAGDPGDMGSIPGARISPGGEMATL